MSYILTLSGRESILTLQLHPPIILKETENYELGLINFVTYNTIPNVDKTNNKFYFGQSNVLEIPEGTYEIEDISKILTNFVKHVVPAAAAAAASKKKKLASNTVVEQQQQQPSLPGGGGKETAEFVKITVNHNTLRCEIKGTQDIYFNKPNSLAKILGFEERILSANKLHISDYPINISKVNAVCCECNLVTNSYNNNHPSHILHMFYPTVPPGYKIVETPSNVIYLPINTRYLNEVIIKITDQDGNLVNFNKELITVRVHLRPIKQ